MKKLAAILFCLLLAFSFVACSGAGGGNGGSGNGGDESANGGDNSRQSEYYPDAAIEGQNTFTLTKKSKDGNDAVLTLKIGGNDVKIAGFKLFVKFDKKIEVGDVKPYSDFMSMTENKAEGVLTLLWAGTENIASATDICDISFNLNGASNLTFKVEIAYGGLGYIDENSVPPVKNIRGNGSTFKLT